MDHDPEAGFVREFGQAAQSLGISRMMGQILALLTLREETTSLDEIANRLGVSKGPASQSLRRLRDLDLVLLENRTGDRRDYYRVAEDLPALLLRHHAEELKGNWAAARRALARRGEGDEPAGRENAPRARLERMEAFYRLLFRHLNDALLEWRDRGGEGEVGD